LRRDAQRSAVAASLLNAHDILVCGAGLNSDRIRGNTFNTDITALMLAQ
jgi:hypothetical protein